MKELRQEQAVIRQYLLGELDDDDRQQVEQRLLTERDYKEEVLIAEDELLEDFIAGALEERERELFLKNYLSAPLQKRKLTIAQALNKYAANATRPAELWPRESWWQKLIDALRARHRLLQIAGVAIVLLAILGSWWVFQAWRRQTQQALLQAELERLNGPQSTVLEAGDSVASLQLSPLSVREDGGTEVLTITNRTQFVQLRLVLASGQYQSYRAALNNSRNEVILNLDQLAVRANSSMLVLQLPATVFNTDDYTLTLAGLKTNAMPEEIGDYSFRVIVRQ